MSKQPPPAPTVSAVGPCPTVIQISRTPRRWKFTQHHRTTQPPTTETRRKATFSCFGKTDVLKVNTKMFVSFNASSRRTLILRIYMTSCSLISSRISSSLTPFKSGQRTTPLQVLREACRDSCTFRLWNDFKRNRFSIFFCMYIPQVGHLSEDFLYFLAHQPCQSRLSHLRKEKDLLLTFLLVNK